MKRRRRRGLGSSAAEHGSRATMLYRDATGAAADTARLAAKGHCPQAAHELQRANRIYGSALEASHGAGWSRPLPKSADAAMRRADQAFERHCVR